MNAWGIIRNIGSIISFFKIVRSFIMEVAVKKQVPECASRHDLLEGFEMLLRKKVIDIPNVNEEEIADALKQIREQLQCKLPPK